MEETNTKELDDVDREGLVKEIEQIRQALGSVSNTDQSDARSELTEYELDEDEVADRDSEDTEDELGKQNMVEWLCW